MAVIEVTRKVSYTIYTTEAVDIEVDEEDVERIKNMDSSELESYMRENQDYVIWDEVGEYDTDNFEFYDYEVEEIQ